MFLKKSGYSKTADTFPKSDEVTSMRFASFIGIGSPNAPVKIKSSFLTKCPDFANSLTSHANYDNMS